MRISDWSSDVCSSDLLPCSCGFPLSLIDNVGDDFAQDRRAAARILGKSPHGNFEKGRLAHMLALRGGMRDNIRGYRPPHPLHQHFRPFTRRLPPLQHHPTPALPPPPPTPLRQPPPLPTPPPPS